MPTSQLSAMATLFSVVNERLPRRQNTHVVVIFVIASLQVFIPVSLPCYVYPTGIRDPCNDRQCSYGARCTASLDGLSARCECPQRCYDYGDSIDSIPVCGSDGADYRSTCELKLIACREMRSIEKRYDGRCDPCDGYSLCLPTEICQLDDHRRPICRCNDDCDRQVSPVCATDSRTYRNECHLKLRACRLRQDIRVLHLGRCITGPMSPCLAVSCDADVHETCSVDLRTGRARCLCPSVCESRVRPVCGSDDRTYDSECHLQRQSCLTRRRVDIHHIGLCDATNPCHTHKCNYGATCYVTNGVNRLPACRCAIEQDCPDFYDPVCGSDGITYNNKCVMKSANCISEKNTTVVHMGVCNIRHSHNSCDTLICGFYGICENDRTLGSRCICPVHSCSQATGPRVCGSDGVMYETECQLRMTSCQMQTTINVVSPGVCNSCIGVECRHGAVCIAESGRCECPAQCRDDVIEPVCASDGDTYANECVMKRSGCLRHVTLVAIHHGNCDDVQVVLAPRSHYGDQICLESECLYDGQCVIGTDGLKDCVCNFHCSNTNAQVCGSDGVFYMNSCMMRQSACYKQSSIVAVSSEICRANSVQSCSKTEYGCCTDGKTPALGPDQAGCPSLCMCNQLGSFGPQCDANTRQCSCKPGVTGLRCDRCLVNYWGLFNGNSGCTPCRCNALGSEREDCEQMTGRCVCKPHVTGLKCNYCTNGKSLGVIGCSGKRKTSATVKRNINQLLKFSFVDNEQDSIFT